MKSGDHKEGEGIAARLGDVWVDRVGCADPEWADSKEGETATEGIACMEECESG